MSAFLGPIHFWLYNKIQFQENLIDELVAYVTAKGWSDKADQYVSTDRRKLDEVIDEANIHGWLQSRIHDAEGRYAALVLDAAGDDVFRPQRHRKPSTASMIFSSTACPATRSTASAKATMPALPGIEQWISTVNFGRATATATMPCVRPWSTDSCRLRATP